MKKKKILIIVVIIIAIISLFNISKKIYNQYRIDHAIKIVKLIDDKFEVYSKIKLSEIIREINGDLIEDIDIDTKELGKKEITFSYITDEKIKVPYTIDIEIVDSTPPIISLISNKTVYVNTSKKDFEMSLFCGDNYDNNPKCYIEGDYNLKEIGTYQVQLIGEDSSNNKSEHTFNLIVKDKPKSSGKSNNNSHTYSNYTDYDEIVEKYKTKDTKIGIDISHWQGDIDFNKVKKSKVEFVYIRVGRGDGIGKDYVLDTKFEEYIKGFNKVGIPVGVYFYSNANSKSDAVKEAKWVISKIKKYKVDLEVAFDWENWNSYQEFDLSFYNLTETAKAFIETIEKAGYKGMNYSSKNYLENIWYPIDTNIWLAHYTEKTNYEGKYKVWQLCDDGRVNGINDNYVDIDIMYK